MSVVDFEIPDIPSNMEMHALKYIQCIIRILAFEIRVWSAFLI